MNHPALPRWIGFAALATAGLTVIATAPGWLTIGFATLAWAALATDRRLGVLPAAVLVVLALPYDRAADVGIMRVAGIPVRPHDVVIGLALLASLPTLGRVRMTVASWLLAAFAVIGVAALLLGFANDHPLRDILRDARWWGLYAVALVLPDRPGIGARVLRGVLIGLVAYSLLLVAVTLTPLLEGGLKERAMAFDLGLLRLQFGPTGFLLIPIGLFAMRIAGGRGRRTDALLLGLAAIGLTLSLTRFTFVVLVAVLGLVALTAIFQRRLRPVSARLRTTLAAAALVVLAVGIGLGVNAVGVEIARGSDRPQPGVTPQPSVAASLEPSSTPSAAVATPGPQTPVPTPTHAPVGPISPRLTIDVGTLLASLTDRFEGYVTAVELIGRSPWIGHGLGTLVDVDYEFGAGEFDTPGKLPNVDNAYLTVAMKAGIVGVVAFVPLLLWPAWRLARGVPRSLGRALLPGWLGLVALTFTQSFAVIGHSPFVIGLLIVAVDRLMARSDRRIGHARP